MAVAQGSERGFTYRKRLRMVVAAAGSAFALAGTVAWNSQREREGGGVHSVLDDRVFMAPSSFRRESQDAAAELQTLLATVNPELENTLKRYPAGFVVVVAAAQMSFETIEDYKRFMLVAPPSTFFPKMSARPELGGLIVRKNDNEKSLAYVSFRGGRNVSVKMSVPPRVSGGSNRDVLYGFSQLFDRWGRFQTDPNRISTLTPMHLHSIQEPYHTLLLSSLRGSLPPAKR